MGHLDVIGGYQTYTAFFLSDTRHGFVPRRSCLTQLIVTEELITCMTDQGEPVDVLC